MQPLSYCTKPLSLPTPFPFSLSHKPSLTLLPRVFTSLCQTTTSTSSSSSSSSPHPTNYAGVKLEETVSTPSSSGKVRLDSWITSRIEGISRARVQSSIKSGFVTVNGRVVDKVSHCVRTGDKVDCAIKELQPLKAEPEDIPVDIVYEDDHVLVVNKPPHMVVHPAPGNASGTLVNAILHHCSLPTFAFTGNGLDSEEEDASDDDFSNQYIAQSSGETLGSSDTVQSVRPGIVHRLDKGTSGLLVVAKNEHAHCHLSKQFKKHTIQRIYISLTSGMPSPISGRIEVPIGRDVNNRIRMAAIPGPSNCASARHAASRYKVIEVLAGGSSALVEWRLETGRTHQIRAHAKFIGIPLLGDEVYGGTKNRILSMLHNRLPGSSHGHLPQLVSDIERPCLHAMALGFTHPHSGQNIHFSCEPPEDFSEILRQLRKLGSEKPSLKT